MIVSALEKFKFNHFGHDQVVLHENEIRRRKGLFNIFKDRDHQQAFMDELTQVIEFSNFILISATIDKRTLKKQHTEDNAYHIALGLCMETLHEFLSEKNESTKKTHIVVECRGNKEDRELELEFRRMCDGNNRLAIPLPFEILFADKKVMSTGLQLADLVARPIGLHTLRPEQPNKAFDVLIKEPAHQKAISSNVDWEAFPIAEMRSRGYFDGFSGSARELKEYCAETLTSFISSVSNGFKLAPAMLRTSAHLRTNDKETDQYALWAWL